MKPRTWSWTSAVIVAFGASGLSAQAPVPPPAAKIVATVNGEPIGEAEVEHDVAMLVKDRYKFHAPTEPQRRELRMEVIQVLVDDALMRQFLAKSGIQVPPAEVVREMADVEARLKKQSRTLQEFCKESGQTEAQVRDSVLNMLRWTNYVKARIGEADVKRYYDENKESFDQVMVRASHILIRVGPGASEVERQAARQKLAALRADILAGKIDFAEAAKKHSQCGSAPNGGDVGFFARKWMQDEAFAKAAFALPIGGVSDIVPTDVGLHLIQTTERKQGKPSDYEKIKDEVRLFYVEELRQELLAKERKTAQIEMKPF